MIKVGTLCWLVNMQAELAKFNGRVVEVTGPLALREFRIDGRVRTYIVDAPWLRELARSLGIEGFWFGVEPQFLKPFSDPGAAMPDQQRRPHAIAL